MLFDQSGYEELIKTSILIRSFLSEALAGAGMVLYSNSYYGRPPMEWFSRWLESHVTLHTHDSREEEVLNSITHAVGAVLSLCGLVLLLIKSLTTGNTRFVIAALVFGWALMLTYTSSSLYHIARPSNRKRFLRIMDHVNIYLLIAGTYTPLCVVMNNPVGNRILLLIWLIAALGILFKLIFWGRVKPLHTIIYLLMGWLIVFFFQDMKESLPQEVFPWIIGGGISYTVGTLFYASKKLPHYHAVWHGFVLLGSGFHFLGIYFHVFPG